MKTLRTAVFGMALAGLVALGGCDSNKKTASADTKAAPAMGMMNDKCPYSGEPVNKSIKRADYNGCEIGFCCAGCAAKWAKASDADKAKMCAKVCPAK